MRKKKVIEQYRGPLSPTEIAAGMNAAMRNARRLLDDARLLMKEGRFPSACSMAILSIEESGKLPLLRQIATAVDEGELKQAWRRYRDHQAKNVAWIVGELAKTGAKSLDDLRPIFDPDSEHPAILDSIKQLGFYTDCYGDRHWSEPFEVVEEGLAKSLIWVAEILCAKKGDVSAREIELWVEHVGPYDGSRGMAAKLVKYYAALDEEGLAHGTLEDFRKFVLGEVE